ncbi:uncharacterized protein N7484_000282 [Penicillium longicatenatum]|uniref:uncharacterized protein n=1 Tax=Penicillium longicatenatum TaxID=1561947 RepID=UPI002549201D|nr:uncharacterized protein N7484_000282 [Penicillium longicatenatum]KAJ5660910.1 hypothetical protein N7484_000282 [Penicillium longicatenatum]
MLPKTSGRGAWKEIQTGFLSAVAGSTVLLQILFLANMCYLYATQFQDSTRVHNLKMLFVDYDGGVVGQAVTDAYQAMKGNEFPTLYTKPTGQYSTPDDVRGAVCSGDYWGAIYTTKNASSSLDATFTNGTASLNTALTYVWNGARYPAFSQSEIYSNLLVLVQASRSTYYASSASKVLDSANLSNPIIRETFLDPIQASEINIKETTQGTIVLYNTVSIVMPIIQQFFFMMALNGISSQFHICTKLGYAANGLVRMVTSLVYTFISSLCMAGYIWGFKESWDVNGNQFALTWMVVWLFMHINFMVVDILTAFIPMQFLPFCIITWVILNVGSSISPFELNPGFFRWGYALPAHEVYQLLVQIWSDGCQDQSYRALPIMFSWWIVGLAVVIYATYHRCQTALMAETETDVVKSSNAELRPSSSTADIVERERRERRSTMESIQLERIAYGPSFPTPGVHGHV